MSLRELLASVFQDPHWKHSGDEDWNTTSERLRQLRSLEIDDTDCLGRALRDYRESSWDDRDFRELPPDVQHAILQRAQEIKDSGNRIHSHAVIHVTEIHG